jgi:site-specific DNA-methyltransferase (adenine-specific)
MTIESTNECYAQVLLGDCLELYKNIEPKSIELILTDLPYGTTACKWDSVLPLNKLWEMVNYLLKSNGTFITTASQPFTSALVMSNPKMFKYEIIWQKGRGTGFVHAKNKPMKYHENILVFSKGTTVHATQSTNRMIYNPQMEEGKPYVKKITSVNAGMMNHAPSKVKLDFVGTINKNEGVRYPKSVLNFSMHNVGNLHPTQKPVALFEYLLKTYSNENMTIFDPCMGSGTTGVACKNLNRSFIGIEKDENYFKIAEQRINERTLFS